MQNKSPEPLFHRLNRHVGIIPGIHYDFFLRWVRLIDIAAISNTLDNEGKEETRNINE